MAAEHDVDRTVVRSSAPVYGDLRGIRCSEAALQDVAAILLSRAFDVADRVDGSHWNRGTERQASVRRLCDDHTACARPGDIYLTVGADRRQAMR